MWARVGHLSTQMLCSLNDVEDAAFGIELNRKVSPTSEIREVISPRLGWGKVGRQSQSKVPRGA